jgi:hypothetical protein
MLRKSAVIALTAAAALGLAISNASAKPGFGGGFKPGIGGGFKPGFKPGGFKPIGLKPVWPGKPKWPGKWPGFKPHKPHWHWHVHRRHYWYAAAPVAAYAVARPAVAGPCTCLSKEYTPDGAVLFKDRCTNEMAMNPPPAPQPAAQVMPQQPQAAYTPSYPPQAAYAPTYPPASTAQSATQ